jgi:hypothetical protein
MKEGCVTTSLTTLHNCCHRNFEPIVPSFQAHECICIVFVFVVEWRAGRGGIVNDEFDML